MSKPRFFGRTLARSQALQLLFQAELADRSVISVLKEGPCLECGPLDSYAVDLALGVEEMLPRLDTVIAARSEGWELGRMPAVDRNLLRIALYEMMEVADVDVSVAINECVELEKAYGTEESPRFANGVLGRVAVQIASGCDPVAVAHDELVATGRYCPGEIQNNATGDDGIEGISDATTEDTEPESKHDGTTEDAKPESKHDGTTEDAGPESKHDGTTEDTGPERKRDGTTEDAGPERKRDGTTEDAGPERKRDGT